MFSIRVIDCDHGWMELQQLRYVVAIAEEASFTRAAERCFVVQSSLSHQVKALERELGVDLFARTSRRVELTPAGAAFLAPARAALAAVDRAASDAAAAAGRVVGSLTIGVIPTVTAIDVPAVVHSFCAAYPEVRVSLRDGGSDTFMTAIRDGELDIAILGLGDASTPSGVASRVLSRRPLAAAIGPRHPLAHRTRLNLSDLAEHAFVDFPAGSPGRAQSDDAFEAAGAARQVMFEARSLSLILGLVREGVAVALLDPGVLPDDASLRSVPVRGAPVRTEYLAWSEFNPSPAALAFLEVLRDL